MTQYPLSDHFNGKTFCNIDNRRMPKFKDLIKYFRSPKSKWPEHVDVVQRKPPARSGDEVIVTWIGHSTFLIQTPLGNIITDPIFSDRASPVSFAGPRRVRAPAIALDDLPQIDLVLLSHNHYDHCDLRSLRAINRKWKPLLITPIGNERITAKTGIERRVFLDWWQVTNAWNAMITLTPAEHFAGRTFWDRNHALWGGFVISMPGCTLYFAGDSARGAFFQEIGKRFGPMDLSMIPIGAYEPRWFMSPVHMNPEEAVEAHRAVKSKRTVGMHWGTFQLTTEGIDAPRQALVEAMAAAGLAEDEFMAVEAGASVTIVPRGAGVL